MTQCRRKTDVKQTLRVFVAKHILIWRTVNCGRGARFLLSKRHLFRVISFQIELLKDT